MGIEVGRVSEILEFLVNTGLCQEKNGRFSLGAQSTHLESGSPWTYSRQIQWRQKAIQQMESLQPSALYYTGPMTLSREDRDWIREKIVAMIQVATERARQSPSEALVCLNVDWFTVYEARKT